MQKRRVNKRALPVGAAAILLTIIPLILVSSQSSTPAPASVQSYAESTISTPSQEEVLAAIGRLTDPSSIGTRAEPSIGEMLYALPNDTVAEYLETLSNLSSNIQNLRTNIQLTRGSLSAGNFTHATENVIHLENLLTTIRSNINSLRFILKTLQAQGWNSTKLKEIQQRIDGIQRISDEYSVQINLLQTDVNLRSPLLHIVLSNSSIFINTTVQVNVILLARNGTPLVGRTVTIIWGANDVELTSDKNGSASTVVHFPIGFPAGNTTITASFEPTGTDATEYVSTYTAAPILVEYYPSEITAQVYPSEGMPLDFVTANGTLTTAEGMPLTNRTLVFSLDNAFVGTAMTNDTGSFRLNFQIFPSSASGSHSLLIFFSPRRDVIAPASANLAFTVIRDRTSTDLSVPGTMFSGTALPLNGRVYGAAENPGGLVGNVIFMFDGTNYGTVPVGADGTFSSSQFIPMSTGFGSHTIQMVYSSDDPRVAGSEATMALYVVNSPAVLVVGIFCALIPGVFVVRRRTVRAREDSNRARRDANELAMGSYPLARPPDWDKVMQLLQAERAPSGLIVTSFRLARTLLTNAIGKSTKESETHWEFYAKIITFRPNLRGFLRPLVKLFEVAEYSSLAVSTEQGQQAKQILIELHDTNQI